MPQVTLHDAPPTAGLANGVAYVAVPDWIRFAHDVIAGRVPVPPMPTSAVVETALKRVSPDRDAPKWLRDTWNLQERYGGEAIGTYQASPESDIAVLAVGAPQIGELLKHLSDDEVRGFLIDYPDPWPTDEDAEAAESPSPECVS